MSTHRKRGRPRGTTKPAAERLDATILVRCTVAEKATILAAAGKSSARSESAWAREKLLAAAGQKSDAATQLRKLKAHMEKLLGG